MKKKVNYNFGGAIANLAPLLDLGVPGLGTMIGTAASLANQPTNYKPMRQNENPYGFEDGGPIDPPKKVKDQRPIPYYLNPPSGSPGDNLARQQYKTLVNNPSYGQQYLEDRKDQLGRLILSASIANDELNLPTPSREDELIRQFNATGKPEAGVFSYAQQHALNKAERALNQGVGYSGISFAQMRDLKRRKKTKLGGEYQQGGSLQQEPVKPIRKPGGPVAPDALQKFLYKVDTLVGNPMIEGIQRDITYPENAKATAQYKDYLRKAGKTIDPNAYMAPQSMPRESTMMDSLKTGYQDGGEYASGGVYPSGNDKQLSSDSYQVDYPGNATDAKSYGPYQFDDNEVIDMMNQFVYSDEKNLGIDGKSPAELVKPLMRAKGKAEKKVEINPYDEHAKNTIKVSDMSALMIAQAQETQKQSMPDKKYYKCGGKLRYEQGGPIDEIYQGIVNLRPNATKEYGESGLRKMASKIYDSAYEANIPYQDYTAQLFQESSFDPSVVYGQRKSSAGATGISQLMPKTASRLGVNSADPNQAIPASAEEMSRIMNKNASQGYGDSMAAAQQRYNAGGPSFRKFMSGDKQLNETMNYPRKIGTHKAKAFNAPAQEYTYRGNIDPALLNQYAATALRNAPTAARESTAVRKNFATGGPLDDLLAGLQKSIPANAGASALSALQNFQSQVTTSATFPGDKSINPLERIPYGQFASLEQNPNYGQYNSYFSGPNPTSKTAVTSGNPLGEGAFQGLNNVASGVGGAALGANTSQDVTNGLGNQTTLGDILQGIEAASTFRGLGKGAEIDPLYQMQTRQIDDAPIRNQSASAFNAAASNLNTSSASGRNAALQNLYANRIGQEGDALASLANQNKQLASQTEQFNLGQKRLTDDNNARNRAALDQAQSAAFTTLGNTGRALNKKQQGKQAMKYLEATYPDVFNFLMKKIQ